MPATPGFIGSRGTEPNVKIDVTIPEDSQDSPGVLFSSLMDKDGQPYREPDGRIRLYER